MRVGPPFRGLLIQSQGSLMNDVTQKFSHIRTPLVTVPFTQLISTVVTFWPTPSPLKFVMSFMDGPLKES